MPNKVTSLFIVTIILFLVSKKTFHRILTSKDSEKNNKNNSAEEDFEISKESKNESEKDIAPWKRSQSFFETPAEIVQKIESELAKNLFQTSIYKKIQDKEHFEKKLENERSYWSSQVKHFLCKDHVENLEIEYTCLPENDVDLLVPREKGLFVVLRNMKKFFLRVSDFTNRYNLALELNLKGTGRILKLIRYKIVKSRFVGIYQYAENNGTLEMGVMLNELSVFDKVNYMYTTIETTIRFLVHRDLHNMALNIAMLPSNILMTKSSPYSIKLITPLVTSNREVFLANVPEHTEYLEQINKESYHVFLLGKLFYFMIFRVYPIRYNKELVMKLNDLINFMQNKESNPEDENEVVSEFAKEYHVYSDYTVTTKSKSQIQYEDRVFFKQITKGIDVSLIILIRSMLNENCLDRPTLITVRESLLQIKKKKLSTWSHLNFFFKSNFGKMKDELAFEIFQSKRTKFKGNKINNEKLEKQLVQKFENNEKIQAIKEMEMPSRGMVEYKHLTLNEKSILFPQIRPMLVKIIREQINPDNSEGFFECLRFEDTLDDAFLDRIKNINSSCGICQNPDLNDLEKIELQLAREPFEKAIQNKVMIQIFYSVKRKMILRKEMIEHSQTKIAHDHNKHEDHHSLQFEIEYAIFIFMCFVSIFVMLLTLVMRRVKSKIYPTKKFKTFIKN